MALSGYYRYLQLEYQKANAAWRKSKRKERQPCAICESHQSEITSEGLWLCRQHKAEWKKCLPYKSYADQLKELGVSFLSKEEWEKGEHKKKSYKVKFTPPKGTKVWKYNPGRTSKC